MVLLVASPAFADYKDSFRRGIEAVDKQNWGEAARYMRAAIAEKSQEGESVKIYGMRYEDYLPHYYLGLALFRIKDCDSALREWRVSEEQGAIRSSPRARELQSLRQRCAESLVATNPRPTPSPTLAATAIVPTPTPTPPVEIRPSPSPTQEPARNARVEIVAPPTATPFALVKPSPSPTGSTSRTSPSPPDAAGPPARLVLAARAYFGGEYQGALDALSRVDEWSGHTAAQALLLRAAARHALYRLGGQKDEGLKRAALTDIEACRRYDPSLGPDEQAFSPRFRAFFSGREEPLSAAR